MAAQPQAQKNEQAAIQSLSVISEGMVPGAIDVVEESGIPSANDMQSWGRRGLLEQNAPPARAGYVQKWIRMVDIEGNPDVQNIESSMKNEGWRPRPMSTVTDGRGYSTAKWRDKGDVIYVGGMVLMERKSDVEQAMRAQMKAHTDRKTQAVKGDQFEGADSRYANTRYEQERTTSVGGRTAPVDD